MVDLFYKFSNESFSSHLEFCGPVFESRMSNLIFS